MANFEFNCSCGKYHKIEMKYIYVGENIYLKIVDIVKEILPKHILIASDNNTYRVLEKMFTKSLRKQVIKLQILF